MPVKLQLLTKDGARWVDWCKHEAEELHLLAKRPLKKVLTLPDGIKAMILLTDIKTPPYMDYIDIITIWGGVVGGFIFHPRNAALPAGFTPSGDAIPAVYGYPLVDNDHGSRLLTGDAGAWKYNLNPPENYGNLDWIGEDGSVVSWRGPASRTFAMDPLHDYPGFTLFDYESADGSNTYYTPYQNLVYQSGEALFEFPVGTKVLGATNVHAILCVDYTGMENPDKGMNGFYLEVWKGIKTRIAYRLGSRASLPWFFSQNGREAVSGDQRLSILTDNDGNETVEFLNLDSGAGSETKQIGPGSWNMSAGGAWPIARDYINAGLSAIQLFCSDNQATNSFGSSSSVKTTLPVAYNGKPATELIVNGPEWYTPGAYTATLVPEDASVCPEGISWEFPSGCGMGVVRAKMGNLSGSKRVRMPEGTWKLISDEFATCSGAPPEDGCQPTYPCENLGIPATTACGYAWLTGSPNPLEDAEAGGVISGSTKVMNYWRWGAKSESRSDLGWTVIDGLTWLVIEKVTFEWWCSETTKGW